MSSAYLKTLSTLPTDEIPLLPGTCLRYSPDGVTLR